MDICKECKQSVSGKAKTCPHCGVRRPGQRAARLLRNSRLFALGAFVLLVVVVVASSQGGNDAKPAATATTTASAPRAVVRNSAWDGSVRQVEAWLDKNLKDPDSYDSIEWGNVVKVIAPGYTYIVRHKYRAKNSLGGYVVEHKLFRLDAGGNVVDVENWATAQRSMPPAAPDQEQPNHGQGG